MMIRHLPKYATIWYPSYVRFFCPPPKPPIDTCDVFLNCEFRKSTSSIHVIINISHPTVPHFLKQFGLKAAPQLYFGHNRSGSFSNIGHFIVSSPELTTPVWDGRIIYPSSALSEQDFFKVFFFSLRKQNVWFVKLFDSFFKTLFSSLKCCLGCSWLCRWQRNNDVASVFFSNVAADDFRYQLTWLCPFQYC